MDLLVGILWTEAVIDAFLGVYFLLLGARRRIDRDYLVFALLCLLHGVYCMLCIGQYRSVAVAEVTRWAALRTVAGVGVAALFVDFGVRVSSQGRFGRWLSRAMYGCVALGVALIATGQLIAPDNLYVHTTSLGRQSIVLHTAHLRPVALALFGPASLGVIAMVARVGWEAWRGPRMLRWIFAAMIIVMASSLWDVLVGLRAVAGIYTVEHSYFLFVLSVSLVLTTRLAEELSSRTAELRQLDETLRAVRETLEKREQLAAVGELSAIVAHEIRNPLGVMANAVASLKKSDLPDTDKRLLLAILEEETARLNRIVGDLLQLARPITPQMRPLDPGDLVERALAPARSSGTDTQVSFAADARGPMRGDAHLLRQALENLVDNAVQAMGGSGTLTVNVVSLARDGARGREISVIDTGEGMNTEVRSRARDAFFTTRPTGTGLGLAIVERIVRAHGGKMDIESARQKGTTVRVWIPEAHASADDSGALAAQSAS